MELTYRYLSMKRDMSPIGDMSFLSCIVTNNRKTHAHFVAIQRQNTVYNFGALIDKKHKNVNITTKNQRKNVF